jgi:hypothetical protein
VIETYDTSHDAPGIAAAVKQTACPPHPTSPVAVDDIRAAAAGNAKRMVEKVS